MTKWTIAIDVMGGDHGPSTTIPAALQILKSYPDVHLILVGDESLIKKMLNHTEGQERLSIQHASQSVLMDDAPSLALRNKKDSSMRVAINLVKEGQAQACVSAGNTGALMVTARFVLKTLPGIDRPAIISAFPTIKNEKCVRILDLGANVDSSAEDLLQFAVMGSVLTKAIDHIERPSVYLLNIGEEDIKGNELVKATNQLLSNVAEINYAGYIEGDQLYSGMADVVVCDGFVGNVALKTTEGVAIMIARMIKAAFTRNFFTKLVGLLTKPILASFVKRIDPGRYNGATFLGLQGTVVKSHGAASIPAFKRAIEEAILGAKNNIPERIRDEVAKLLKHDRQSESHQPT